MIQTTRSKRAAWWLPAVLAGAVFLAAPPSQARKPASHANETLLEIHVIRGSVAVSLNGQRVGSYKAQPGLAWADVSRDVRAGTNSLSVARQGTAAPIGSVDVLYVSGPGHFRSLGSVSFGAATRKMS